MNRHRAVFFSALTRVLSYIHLGIYRFRRCVCVRAMSSVMGAFGGVVSNATPFSYQWLWFVHIYFFLFLFCSRVGEITGKQTDDGYVDLAVGGFHSSWTNADRWVVLDLNFFFSLWLLIGSKCCVNEIRFEYWILVFCVFPLKNMLDFVSWQAWPQGGVCDARSAWHGHRLEFE